MATEQTVLDTLGRALWTPRPTQSDVEAQQLAFALGYPPEWRVVRTLEPIPTTTATTRKQPKNRKEEEGQNEQQEEQKPNESIKDTPPSTGKQAQEESNIKTVPVEKRDQPPKEEEPATEQQIKDSNNQKDEKDNAKKENGVGPEADVNKERKMEDSKQTNNDESNKETNDKPKSKDHGRNEDKGDNADTSKAGSKEDENKDENMADENDNPPKKKDVEETTSSQNNDDKNNTNIRSVDEPKKEEIAVQNDTKVSDKNEVEDSNNKKRKLCIVDRIYAGKPGSGCDMWFHHYGAMVAAETWMEQGADAHRYKGGHLLPRKAMFTKGEKVEVFFDNDWWEAKILRSKEHGAEGFRYQVYYVIDKTKQNNIPEERIRELKTGQKDPHEIAVQIGLGPDWQAVATGNNRWKITAPNGQVFHTKKAALEYIATHPNNQNTETGGGGGANGKDEGDPPWRTTGHEYLGRMVCYIQEHAVSARRTITVEQIGKVVGWISETDVDQAGDPGYVSERTGAPAKLFHVVFQDEPHLHKYASFLVESQDMEEFELESYLIPEDQVPTSTKKRLRKPKGSK